MNTKHSHFLPVLVCGLLHAGAVFGTPIPDDCKTGGFAIGCQTWTFNRFTVMDAIDRTSHAGGKVIEFQTHQVLSPQQPTVIFDYHSPDSVLAQVQAYLKTRGLRAVSYGVVDIPNNVEAARPIFEFAKKMGLYCICTESTGSIDTIEKLVKEYDIKVGFHDHPRRPSDPSYRMWDPNYILSVVKDRDPRIGATADTGHWVRSGLVPVNCLKILHGRIISVHLKDLNEFSLAAHDVPYGTGVSDVPGILDELKRQNFDGNISVEYEYDWLANVVDAAQCIGFVRGYGARKD